MTDLMEWLTGVWDEDEARVRAAIDDDCGQDGGFEDEFDRLTKGRELAGPLAFEPSFGDAAARRIVHDTPRRALSRIAADRKILELHAPTPTTLVEVDGREVEQDSFEEIVGREVNCMACAGYPAAPCQTLLLLASTYADRPGYRSEWAV